jgi:hypothetical protein
MKSKKNILLVLTLAAIVTITLLSDYILSQYGRGLGIFKAKLPSGITLKYDNIEGYKFLEEGFIHIIDEHTVFEKDTIVKILAYLATNDNVFIKASTRKNIFYINIHVMESLNNDLKYELKRYRSSATENWIDLSSNDSLIKKIS